MFFAARYFGEKLIHCLFLVALLLPSFICHSQLPWLPSVPVTFQEIAHKAQSHEKSKAVSKALALYQKHKNTCLPAAKGLFHWKIGLLHMSDKGSHKPDFKQARAAFLAAAQCWPQAGSGAACQNLGVMYDLGLGVTADPEQARIFYHKALTHKTDKTYGAALQLAHLLYGKSVHHKKEALSLLKAAYKKTPDAGARQLIQAYIHYINYAPPFESGHKKGSWDRHMRRYAIPY
jgi:TPR repeat protein